MQPAREASSSDDIVAAFERASAALGAVRRALRGAVFGQDEAVELVLTGVVAGGHALIAGAPGLAKTRLATAAARAFGLSSGAVQFTPDLEAADLTGRDAPVGVEARRFRTEPGPIFTNLLVAEDLDRASPRLQTFLFEAMEGGEVSGPDGVRRLPLPFHVLATRSGAADAVALTDSLLDRFLLQVGVGYPGPDDERRLLLDAGRRQPEIAPVSDLKTLLAAQRLAVELPVGESVVTAILELVRRARPDDPAAPAIVREAVARGPGPRAGQSLMRLARARALLDGRASPSLADVRALALPVLGHRLRLRDGAAAEEVVGALGNSL